MRVGLTSTIPVEIVLAAGHQPLDLNNIFVSAPAAADMVRDAEAAGYPRSACSWVKGIYTTIIQQHINTVIVVTQGDCSQMQAMMETLHDTDVCFIPFAYPYDRDPNQLHIQMQRLLDAFDTSWEAAVAVQQTLRPLRAKVGQLDEITWRQGTVTGYENHLYQVSCSDFWGDIGRFGAALDELLAELPTRRPPTYRARVGLVGVPPIYSDLYQYLDKLGLHVAFNETQRQFTMLPGLDADLLTQYLRYTYPYDIFTRLEDIAHQTANRQLEGIIHYVQSFCFRQIHDRILREALDCPVLTLEGDRPGALTPRDKLRLEAFAETLEARGQSLKAPL